MSVRLVASSALSFSPWLLDFYLGIEVYKSADSIHSFRHSAYIRCGFITMIDHFPHFVRPFHTTYHSLFQIRQTLHRQDFQTWMAEDEPNSCVTQWISSKLCIRWRRRTGKVSCPKVLHYFSFHAEHQYKMSKKKRLRFVVERDFRLISSFFSINVTEERTVPRLSLPPFSRIDMYFDINNSITIF